MGKYYNLLLEDIRFEEGMNACMNCGVCTAICPAAEFYNYDPRKVVDTVQKKDDNDIIDLLKSETIWYCGECMSCKTRCPRGNTPGFIIMALRTLSQKTGLILPSQKRDVSNLQLKGQLVKIFLSMAIVQLHTL